LVCLLENFSLQKPSETTVLTYRRDGCATLASSREAVYNSQTPFRLPLVTGVLATTLQSNRTISEDEIVRRIARAIPSAAGGLGRRSLRVGIGDDAAIVVPGRNTEWVLSCDAFIEGVHFLADRHPPDSVGYKSLARAASDLAAMGAAPRLFLLTLALPGNRTGTWLDGFLRGMGRAARSLGMRLAGGDTTKSRAVSISITVLGDIAPRRAVTRSGARPGDIIYVSGTLGRAELGLRLIRRRISHDRRLRRLLRPHLYPRIRIDLGEWLAANRVPSAMMDLSDGLSTDLARLCAASGVGARLHADRIPRITSATLSAEPLAKLRLDSLQLALHGGDDYELLFTVSPRRLKKLRNAPAFRQLTAIGEITREQQIVLAAPDGEAGPLDPLGWDPFRKK
jgi:thiamine-monophosphate kinase